MASTSDAEAHKAQGNAHFSSGKYAEAVACYTKAIEAADPVKNARNCAIYYTNRSAAYYALKQLSNALDDATKAYKIDPTWAKALWRQSAAYTALSKPREALAAVSKARSLSGPSVDPGILADFKTCSFTYIADYFRIPTRSVHVQVRWIDENMGRGVFNVKEGTTDENIIIYREKPLVSQIRPKSRLACAYCLQTKLVPEDLKPLYEAQWDFMYKDQVEPHKWYDCEKCGSSPLAGERYCSESCRGAAKQKYHELMCPKSEWWSDAHPGEQIPHPIEAIWNLCCQGNPCLINPLLIARIMATVVNIIASNNGSQKSIDDALEPYKLFSASEKPPKELASTTVVCVRAIYHAKYRSNPELLKVLDGVITEELYSELHGILTRNAHHLNPLSDFHIYLEGLSAFNQALLVSQYDEEMKPMDFVQTEWMKNLTVEGTGLFEITNSINHSCRPNSMVVHCNTDHTISVVSKTEITHGTEITISYIDETLPKAERQAKLKEFYNFECKCVKCLEES